jgi:hypothetical protein
LARSQSSVDQAKKEARHSE